MIQKLKNLYYRAYTRFLRLFLPVLVVVSIIGFSCLSALAVAPPGRPVNIISYKTSVHTEGDAAIVQGTIPLDQAQTLQKVVTGKIQHYSHTFDRAWFHFDQTTGDPRVGSYLVGEIFPMGYFTDKNTSNLSKCISLVGLPNGTRFSVDATIGGVYDGLDPQWTYGNDTYEVKIVYFDSEGNNISGSSLGDSEYHYDTEKGAQLYTSFTIEAPAGAVAFRIQYKCQVRILSKDSTFFIEDGVHSLTFRYIVNQLEYESSLSDYENNRPVDPQKPEGSDKFDELDDLESGLIQDAESYLDSYYELMDSTGIRISTLGNTFMVIKFLLQSFLDIPAVNTLISVSLILGLSGTILGIVGNVRIRKGE